MIRYSIYLSLIVSLCFVAGCCGTIPTMGSDTTPPNMVYRPIGAHVLIEDQVWYESPEDGIFVHSVIDGDDFHLQVAFDDPGMIRSIEIIAMGGIIRGPSQAYRFIVEPVNHEVFYETIPSDKLTVMLDNTCPDDTVNIVFKLEKRPELISGQVRVAMKAVDYSGNQFGRLTEPNGHVMFDFD